MEIVPKLRKLRKLNKISQKVLSGHIGVHASYVSQVERGVHNPSLSVVEAWCKALGCELNIILNDFK